jgi:Protein of unknown function (DUF3309)
MAASIETTACQEGSPRRIRPSVYAVLRPDESADQRHHQFHFVVTEAALAGNCLPKYAGKSRNHRMGLIILILVILLLIGAFPTGGYGYGYRSHGIIGTILIIVLILYLLGRL